MHKVLDDQQLCQERGDWNCKAFCVVIYFLIGIINHPKPSLLPLKATIVGKVRLMHLSKQNESRRNEM